MTKLLAISITVLSGFRGGFIFPLFLVGTSLGQMVTGLHIPFVSGLPPVLLCMCFAAGGFPNLCVLFLSNTKRLFDFEQKPIVLAGQLQDELAELSA